MIDGLVGQTITELFRLVDSTTELAITGETFTASLGMDGDGSVWAGPTVTEIGGGEYQTSFPATVPGVWIVDLTGDDSGEVMRFTWTIADTLDPSLLHSAPITSAMALIQGDDYLTIDGRALIFALDNVADLTGATVTLTIAVRAQTITAPGTVTNPGASTQTVTVELTAAQTATLPVGAQSCRYDLAAVLANTHKVTLARGMVTVTADVP